MKRKINKIRNCWMKKKISWKKDRNHRKKSEEKEEAKKYKKNKWKKKWKTNEQKYLIKEFVNTKATTITITTKREGEANK